MDLFTYLMAKNGNNSSVHGDLFSYLLGKAQGGGGEIKTATGITINIPDAKKLVSFMMTKESTQYTTTGKQLFEDEYIPAPNTKINAHLAAGTYCMATVDGNVYGSNVYIKLSKNGSPIQEGGHLTSFSLNSYSSSSYSYYGASGYSSTTFTIDDDYDLYIGLLNSTNTRKVVLVSGETIDRNYEEYTGGIPSPNPDYPQEVKTVKGSVDVYVSNGETTNTYTINLGNNELVGIGDYKDELIVDKSGHVFINKKTGKFVFNGQEDWKLSGNQPVNGIKFYYSKIFNNIISGQINTHVTLCNYFKAITVDDYTNANLTGICMFRGTSAGGIDVCILNTSMTLNDFKSLLANNNMYIYQALVTPELIDLNTTVDLRLFKGVNNVSNSEDGYMTIEYR